MALTNYEREELARRIELLRESLAELERWFRQRHGLPAREASPTRLSPMMSVSEPSADVSPGELYQALHSIDNAILEQRPIWEIAVMALRQVERWIRCLRASVVEFDQAKGTMRILAVLVGGVGVVPGHPVRDIVSLLMVFVDQRIEQLSIIALVGHAYCVTKLYHVSPH